MWGKYFGRKNCLCEKGSNFSISNLYSLVGHKRISYVLKIRYCLDINSSACMVRNIICYSSINWNGHKHNADILLLFVYILIYKGPPVFIKYWLSIKCAQIITHIISYLEGPLVQSPRVTIIIRISLSNSYKGGYI